VTDPVVRRLTEERQALLALSTPHTAVQWRRLAEIRAQLDGIADADALAARKRALDKLVADAQAMGDYE
jgi:hypothetical protein